MPLVFFTFSRVPRLYLRLRLTVESPLTPESNPAPPPLGLESTPLRSPPQRQMPHLTTIT
eukprot:1180433-Prorocentrum_minimum.AAC.3